MNDKLWNQENPFESDEDAKKRAEKNEKIRKIIEDMFKEYLDPLSKSNLDYWLKERTQ